MDIILRRKPELIGKYINGNYKVTIYEIKDKDSMEIVEVKTYKATKVSFDTPYFDKETGEFVQKLLFNVIRSVNEM